MYISGAFFYNTWLPPCSCIVSSCHQSSLVYQVSYFIVLPLECFRPRVPSPYCVKVTKLWQICYTSWFLTQYITSWCLRLVMYHGISVSRVSNINGPPMTLILANKNTYIIIRYYGIIHLGNVLSLNNVSSMIKCYVFILKFPSKILKLVQVS